MRQSVTTFLDKIHQRPERNMSSTESYCISLSLNTVQQASLYNVSNSCLEHLTDLNQDDYDIETLMELPAMWKVQWMALGVMWSASKTASFIIETQLFAKEAHKQDCDIQVRFTPAQEVEDGKDTLHARCTDGKPLPTVIYN